MFSKILVKLIDQSIVPVLLLLSVRIISIILVGKYLSADFLIGTSGFEFSSQKDYVLVNSYSTLFMVAALALGLFYILIKSMIFHDTHVTPGTTAKLFSLRLQSVIQGSFDLYSQGAIWLSYLYLIMLSSGVLAIFSLLHSWVFFISVGVCIISTVFFVLDVERELHLSHLGEDMSPEDAALHYGDEYA